MAVMPMGKLVFSMSLPLMISLLVQSLYNIVDGIFVARISEDALTATSLAYPIQLLMVAVSVGTGVGVNALIARKLGAKQHDEANQVATTGLVLSVICAVIFLLLGVTCSDFFAHAFTSDPVTAEFCAEYLGICMIFSVGIFIETLAQRLLQATGNTLLSMISLIVGAVTNIILDPILIFGMLGAPVMGIRGAAVATVIGQWCGAAVALGLHFFKNPEIRFSFRGFRLKGDVFLAIYKVGLPTIVMQAIGSVMLSAMNGLIMPISSTGVAFFGAYYKLQNFLLLPMNGLGQAAIPIVGYNYGAKNGQRILQALKIDIPAAVCIGLTGTVIFLLLPGQLLGLFSASDVMLELGVPALRIISLTFAFAAVTVLIGYASAGLGNGVVNMIGAALRQLIILLPVAWLLARLGGINAIWYSMWASEVIAALYCIFSLRHELKKKVYPLLEQSGQDESIS